MLVVLFSGTQMMNKFTAQIRDYSAENALGNIINLQYTVILGATLHKICIKKNDRRLDRIH